MWLTLRNELGPNQPRTPGRFFFRPPTHFETSPNTTNLHSHGLHVGPSGNADNVVETVEPGTERLYEYALLRTHLGGTHWYYPHAHGSTTLQLAGGMAEALIVEDDPAVTPVELLALPEHVLFLQHVHSSRDAVDGIEALNPFLENELSGFSDQQLLARYSKSTLEMQQVGSGDALLVNGRLAPTLTISPQQWRRLRFIHATMSFNLMLRVPGCELRLLANDGVYLMAGVPRPPLPLAPSCCSPLPSTCDPVGSIRHATASLPMLPSQHTFAHGSL